MQNSDKIRGEIILWSLLLTYSFKQTWASSRRRLGFFEMEVSSGFNALEDAQAS